MRRQVHTANALETQLANIVRMFLEDSTRARFDEARCTVHLSQLIDWYKGDLTNKRISPSATTVVGFLSNYVDNPSLTRSLAADRWSVEYTDYDRALNPRP